jgi:rhodanese-related sulfurtransferase
VPSVSATSRTLRALLLVVLTLTGLTLTSCSSAPAPTADPAPQVRLVDATEAQSLIDDGARVIDVRTPEEFTAGHVRGATNLDVQAADFHQRAAELAKDATYVLYCRTGSRAGAAGDMLADMGFTDVVNAGGFDDLAAAGLPTG